MWADARSAPDGDQSNSVSRRALPWTGAIILHVLLFVFAGYLIAPPRDFLKEEPPERTAFAVVRLPPPPPRLDGAPAEMSASITPRFRPRIVRPVGVPLIMT